jgi:preprotein translocase subunit SecA
LRQAVQLRGYGQRDPLHEYKNEAFQLFERMLAQLREDVTGQLMHITYRPDMGDEFMEFGELPQMEAHHIDPLTGEDDFAEPEPSQPANRQERRAAAKQANGSARKPVADAGRAGGQIAQAHATRKSGRNPDDPSTWGKVARNAPCPCGSGRKYKHCHGAIPHAAAE